VAGAEVAEADVTGKCNGITTWPLTSLTIFFIGGEELKIIYTLLFYKRNLLSYHKNNPLFIYIIFI